MGGGLMLQKNGVLAAANTCPPGFYLAAAYHHI
jgi:hypothetical protein